MWYVTYGTTPYNQSIIEGTECTYFADALAYMHNMPLSNKFSRKEYYIHKDYPYIGVANVKGSPHVITKLYVYENSKEKGVHRLFAI